MDLLNKVFGPWADLLKTLTPGARLTAAVLVIVALASVGFLFNQQVSTADAYLMEGESFSASQLRDMHAAFGKAGLEARTDGAKIKVPRGQESKYMAALADANALPPEFGGYLKKAVSTNSFNWVPHGQREAAWRVARQQELQLCISCMQGIEGAAVQIDQEKPEGFSREKSVITAAVMVRPKPNSPLDDVTIQTIRQMVASSVAGLKPEAVTVVDLSNGRHVAGNGGMDVKPGSAAAEYADCKKRQEFEWQQTINRVLGYIPGVLVSVNVELASEAANAEAPKTNDAASIEQEAAATIQRPASSGQKVLDRIRRDILPEAPRKAEPDERVARQPPTLKRVTVSVVVPSTYYENIWRQNHPAPVGQPFAAPDPAAMAQLEAGEKKKIETLVGNLLPRADTSADANSRVAVSTFFPSSAPSLVQPDLRARAMALLSQHGSTLAVVGVALVSLLLLRSTLRSRPAADNHLPLDAAHDLPPTFALLKESTLDDAEPTTSRSRLERRAAQGQSLREELAEIVRDDPDTAASVLRTWIGNAS